MLRKDFNRGNAYFDTYHIFDTEQNKYVGIIEDHHRSVKEPYFIGWKFKDNHFIPNTFQVGKTKMFDTYEEALEYIQEDFEDMINKKEYLENIKVVEYENGFIIQYKGQNLMKWENPVIWGIVKEPCQIYASEDYAKNDIKSFKRYISSKFNGNYEQWESQYKEV